LKVQQSFLIDQPQKTLWEFFDQVDEVARCVPGVEAVEVIDADNSKVRLTQAVGPMTATFDLKMRVTERREQELMQFTAIGRAVRGAAGNVRTVNTVTLETVEGGTQVNLEADLAMGGVLGSVGQKVIAKQAGEVTKQFAISLERAIKGESLEEPADSEGAAAEPAPAVATELTPLPARPLSGTPARAAVLVAVLGLLALVLVRSSRS
jgi:carbon monoxide dehydrogenase subunit G